MHELFAIAFSYMNCVVMGSKFINFISGVVCLRDKEFYFVLTHTENCLAQTSRRHIHVAIYARIFRRLNTKLTWTPAIEQIYSAKKMCLPSFEKTKRIRKIL